MKSNKNIGKKIKRFLDLYNLAIIICIIIIAVSLYIIFKPNNSGMLTRSGIEVVQSNTKKGEEISEKQALKIAVRQFKILNENVKEKDLNIIKIQRNNEKYYYITSANNSLEIKIDSGKVTRINAAPVEE